jgi:alpha-glucosidase
LPVGDHAGGRNVAAQAQDAGSMLALYRALLHVRGERPALNAGSLTMLNAPGDLIAYERRDDQREGASGDAVLVVLNLSDADATFGTASATEGGPLAGGESPAGGELRAGPDLLVATAPGVTLADGVVTLPAHAAAVVSFG